MKKVFLVLGMSTFAFFVNAQTEAQTANGVELTTPDNDKKTEIKPEDLPENVRKSLENVQIVKAFRLTDADGRTAGYEVVTNNGQGESTVMFDKEGNRKN